MLKNLLMACSLFLIIGCSPQDYLKKSANNKYIDVKGFDGSKRRPLYNKKYIDKAKDNISNEDYDEDEDEDDEEKISPIVHNRYMYEDMLKRDMKRKKQRNRKSKVSNSYLKKMDQDDGYPDIAHAKDIVYEKDIKNNETDTDLKKEIDDIKSMLTQAQKDLAKYKCPLTAANENDGENNVINKTPIKNVKKAKQLDKSSVNKKATLKQAAKKNLNYQKQTVKPDNTYIDSEEENDNDENEHDVSNNQIRRNNEENDISTPQMKDNNQLIGHREKAALKNINPSPPSLPSSIQ